jgi:PAS domain S-box-containing protein
MEPMDDEHVELRAEVARLKAAEIVLTDRAARAEAELRASRARGGVNIDVTDQSRALQALRESEERVRVAVEAAGVGLWGWDPDTDELVWAPALYAIFGLAPHAAPPATRDEYLAFVHPEDRAFARSRIESGMSSGHWADEYRIVRPDGEVRWIMARKNVLRGGARTQVIGAVIDVTERRRRDEQLRQAQRLEAVGQLTAGIAHNFNNMLMGILPNLELLARRAPAELMPLVDTASNAARRAAELVRKLMAFTGRHRSAARTVEDLGPLAARAVELCRTTFDLRIRFEQQYQGGSHARIEPSQVEQAIVNILINARDALDHRDVDEPRVSISVEVVKAGASELGGRGADHVRIRVDDNGEGMDADVAARIYDPFFATKPVGRGTGLGLATTRAIVQEHGGFIVCDSMRGRGTTLSLYFPHEAGASPAREPPIPAPQPTRGTETVLIVDDEPGVRGVVSQMLRSAGYVVHEAASGAEALSLLTERGLAAEVALVLLDVSMPGLPRGEIRSRLRELTRAHVIYFTGYGLDASDADDLVLEKPVTEAELLEAVRRVIDRAR